MSLTFTPKSEKEVSSFELLPEGDYDFEVLTAEHAMSKGNAKNPTPQPMIKLKLRVWGPNGSQRFLYDYLMVSVEYKLRHFCDSVGLLSQYEQGLLAPLHCQGRAGKCHVIIRVDKKWQYLDQNKVKDYLLREAKPIVQGNTAPAVPFPAEEDDIPF